ncbi:MAG: metal-dependent hydrolase [bacterium]
MKIRYLGHAAFYLEDGKHRLVIDPFLSGNPNATVKPEDLKVDYVLITHAHPDHMGDSLEIAEANNATVISTFEIATYCESQGVAAHSMHIGGSHPFPFGKVKLTIAHHGCSLPGADGLLTLGPPCGMLITLGKTTVYHTGDTGLFYDMKLIGEMTHIDLALIPIGDNYTMGIDDAVKAVELLRPALAVPMHYNTFDVIKADPEEFARRVGKLGLKAKVLTVGEELTVECR